ncbi:MAG: hypothetical protein QOF81_3018 [Acidimicrobiaceae bacterium]|nr:hypothetical protein [Acidimicrobiaceae bacterium]
MQVRGPLAPDSPWAWKTAVAPGSTLPTGDPPSLTLLPDESRNWMSTTYVLALELWLTIVPSAVGRPPPGSSRQAVIDTSFSAALLELQPASSGAVTKADATATIESRLKRLGLRVAFVAH